MAVAEGSQKRYFTRQDRSFIREDVFHSALAAIAAYGIYKASSEASVVPDRRYETGNYSNAQKDFLREGFVPLMETIFLVYGAARLCRVVKRFVSGGPIYRLNL